MTNYHEVKNVLKESEKPLSCKQISEETGIRYKVVNRIINRMQKRGKVIANEDYRGNYSVTYLLRKDYF